MNLEHFLSLMPPMLSAAPATLLFWDWLFLPLIIYFARVMDVSIATIRVIFIMNGHKRVAALLGFVESMIWLIAIGQIIRNISNPISYIAYAGGYATGTFLGMKIEEKLALGKVLIRVFTRHDTHELFKHIEPTRFNFNRAYASDKEGDLNILITVILRKELPELIELIHRYNPKAYYTIENVRYVNEPYEEKAAPATAPKSRVFNLALSQWVRK